METPQIIVFLVVAIAVGALTIGLIASWNADGAMDSIKNLINPGEDKYDKVSYPKFVTALYQFSEKCMKEGNDNLVVYVEADHSLSRSLLEQSFDDLSWTFSDNIEFSSTIELPNVVRLSCENSTGAVTIN